jgi:hypothetical protein
LPSTTSQNQFIVATRFFECVHRSAAERFRAEDNSCQSIYRDAPVALPMSSSDAQPESSVVPSARRRTFKRAVIALSVLAWVAGVAWGLQKIQAYSSTPGEAAAAPFIWPGSALVAPVAGRDTLVMFIHPQCSCTRASLAELQTILDDTHGAVSAWVVVLKPHGMGDDWTHSATWDTASHMAGVTVVMDDEGSEAALFGADTSGHTVVYDAKGKLLFSGGITRARGHVGSNAGRDSVVSLVQNGTAESNTHEVFGCGLHDPHPRL